MALLLFSLQSSCLGAGQAPQIVEDGGPSDLDLWVGECPFNSNSSCRGLVQAVSNGKVTDSFAEEGYTLIASGMNRLFVITNTYTFSYSADGQHEYEALNVRYFTASSDEDTLCEQATVFQLKKADGLVYAPVTEAVDTDEPFGLAFLKDGQRGNKLWLKPYAIKKTERGANATLPVLTLTMLPTTVLSSITKRACTIEEINDGDTACFDHVLRKTRHERIEIQFPVQTVKSHGVGHNEVEELCWKSYAIDQGTLLPPTAEASSRSPLGLGWLLLAVLIVLALLLARR
jgi:hypothetical protein